MEWPASFTALRERFLPRRDPNAEIDDDGGDAWATYVSRLRAHGIPVPGAPTSRRPATVADEQALYDVAPSFVELLPWLNTFPPRKACCSRMACRSPRFSSLHR